jgi:hypothetical protein
MSEKTPDIICMARLELLDMIEEIGAAATHLRESYRDFEDGNTRGAEMCADDALEIMGTIERMASEISSSLAKWIDYKTEVAA